MARIAATGKEKALWLLEELVPGTGINNIGIAVQVAGRLRPDALSASVAIMLDRYQTLRTVFYAAEAELVKEVVPAGSLEVGIEPIELGGDPLDRTLSAFVGRPFTLAGQPLVRVGRAAHPDGDILCLAVHHLVFDAISIGLFLQAFIGVYAAGQPGDPPEERGVALAHDTGLAPAPRPASLDYWRENLRGFDPGGLGLWCGTPHVRKPLMTGGTVTHTLSQRTRDALPGLQREVRAPVAAVLLAAYYALLAAHGAGPDLIVGSPVDVRGAQAAPAIGYHVNVVPLRLRVDLTESFRQLARRTRDVFLAALGHADLSVDDMTADLPRTGSSWQSTLYRHMFNFLPDTTAGELVIDGMPARLLPVDNGFSKFDLELFVVPGQPDIRFRYRDEILARDDVTAMLSRYEAILAGAAADPDRPVGELAWSEQDRAVISAASEGTRAYIAAPDGRELPVGVRGELDADDPLVKELTVLWQRLLDPAVDVTARTAFFDAGGHSLLAAKLAQDIEELTGIHLELSEIFEYPTPAALAARLTAQKLEGNHGGAARVEAADRRSRQGPRAHDRLRRGRAPRGVLHRPRAHAGHPAGDLGRHPATRRIPLPRVLVERAAGERARGPRRARLLRGRGVRGRAGRRDRPLAAPAPRGRAAGPRHAYGGDPRRTVRENDRGAGRRRAGRGTRPRPRDRVAAA